MWVYVLRTYNMKEILRVLVLKQKMLRITDSHKYSPYTLSDLKYWLFISIFMPTVYLYLICVLYNYIPPTMFISQATNALQVSRPTWIEEWEKAPGENAFHASIPSFKMSFNQGFETLIWILQWSSPNQQSSRAVAPGSNKPPPQYNRNGIHETASTTHCLERRTRLIHPSTQDKHPPLFSHERVTTRWSPTKSP